MVVYLSSVFSPNMFPNRLKTVTVFTRISEKRFVRELREAYENDELVNIINHKDTVQFLRKLSGVNLRPNFKEIVMQEDDKMLLFTVKDKHRHKSIEEAYRKGFVRFYLVEVVL